MNFPTLKEITAAAARIKPYIHRTPVLTCSALDEMCDAQFFFKCENFQKVGAFKFRGACNAVFSLEQEKERFGVATHSSGNHAAALALAARKRGMKAYIVMPRNSPDIKKEAVKGYGGEIEFCEPTLAARESGLAEVIARTHAEVVHPYNDRRVIAGQATAALEIFEEIIDLDIIMTPVGGGGLLSGTALTTFYLSPRTRVIAAEPEAADDAFRSFRAGKIIPVGKADTIADGLKTSLGEITFPIIRKHVHDIVTASEESIAKAMRHIWERMKIVVEPSSAVPLAALLEKKIETRGKRIGIVLSGGNVDLEKLPWKVRESDNMHRDSTPGLFVG